MIIETVTVTTTPTSLYSLINTERSSVLPEEQHHCVGLTIRNLGTVDILISDPDTNTPVLACDASESQIFESHLTQNIHQTLLSASENVTAGIIISQ